MKQGKNRSTKKKGREAVMTYINLNKQEFFQNIFTSPPPPPSPHTPPPPNLKKKNGSAAIICLIRKQLSNAI